MMDITQLVTPTEAADMKGISLNRLKYHLKKPGAPKPVVIGRGHVFFNSEQMRLWRPQLLPAKRKAA